MLMLVSVRRETERIEAPSQSMARIWARVFVSSLFEQFPFQFVDNRPRSNARPLHFNDLWGIYNNTPGFDSDKLKAVLEHVGRIIANAKIRGIVFAYDEAQNLSDKKDKGQHPLSLVVDVFSNLQKRDLGCQFLLILSGLPTLITNLNEARTYTERMFHTFLLDRLSRRRNTPSNTQANRNKLKHVNIFAKHCRENCIRISGLSVFNTILL